MDSKHVYSSSLKRMLGFKLFPNINPQQVLITDTTKPNQKLTDFVQSKKTDQQIEKMKKEIAEARKKQLVFQKEIDNIMGKMVEDGYAQVVSKKVRKHGSTHKLRIVTEANQEGKNKYHVQSKPKKNTEDSPQKLQSSNLSETAINQKQKWKIATKLPQIKKQVSHKQLPKYRLKTETDVRTKNEPEPYNADNAERLIRHYRAGMSSLKKLKIRSDR